jgi:ubiquinone/menaquinone biosynthesis C-methylase UbiE
VIYKNEKPGRELRYYRWYYEHHFGGEDFFRKEMLSTIMFSEGERVLDLCCGTGGLTLAVRQKAGPPEGVL